MNPFTMRGPEFLALYVLLCGAALLWMRHARRAWMAEVQGVAPLSDPYLLAFARGGAREAVRLAVTALRDRGSLSWDDRALSTTTDGRAAWPLERAILGAARAEALAPRQLEQQSGVKRALDGLRDRLARQGLIESSEQLATRKSLSLILIVGLAAFALLKIVVALVTGHHNLAFLVILVVVWLLWATRWLGEVQHPAVPALVEDAQVLFSGVHQRAVKGETLAGDDLVFLGAAFGAFALPEVTQALWQDTFGAFQRRGAAADSSGSSCGSSCGSSSCGGGSCGGGCGGGCGGCGS